ncbi:MAG: hypothetical protein R3C19_08010 [Planctomycetaceae bacterium]
MKLTQPLPTKLVRLTLTAALVLSQPLSMVSCHADEASADPKPVVRDVQLKADGLLQMKIVDGQGVAQANQPVQVRFADKTVAKAVTDESGDVRFRGLRPGLHVVAAPHGAAAFRFWNEEQAPPSALKNPAIVSDSEVVRGQMGGAGLGTLLGVGLGIAGIVLAIDAKDTADDANARAASLQSQVDAIASP